MSTHRPGGHPAARLGRADPGGHTYRQVYINKMQFQNGLPLPMKEFWDPKRILGAQAGRYDREQAS